MFSMFKRTDSHTVRGRPTRKDGVVIYERLSRNLSFRELKRILKNHELAKILLEPEPNQESNDECYQWTEDANRVQLQTKEERKC